MARHVFAVGHIKPKPEPKPVARACAWCNRFYTFRDMQLAADGAPVTHGMCPECSRGPGRAA